MFVLTPDLGDLRTNEKEENRLFILKDSSQSVGTDLLLLLLSVLVKIMLIVFLF